MTTAIAS